MHINVNVNELLPADHPRLQIMRLMDGFDTGPYKCHKEGEWTTDPLKSFKEHKTTIILDTRDDKLYSVTESRANAEVISEGEIKEYGYLTETPKLEPYTGE